MPSHQERREPLPKGYQFGDARGGMYIERAAIGLGRAAADEFAKRYLNVIEGEHDIEGVPV